MSVPLIATFRKLSRRAPLDELMRTRVVSLETLCPSLVGVRVLVERRDGHRRSGTRVHVRITLEMRGPDIVIEHQASTWQAVRALASPKVRKQDELDGEYRHADVAVRAAFSKARRRLQDHLRRERAVVFRQAG